MDNYFQNISPKISGSQEDNQISIIGCPHSFYGRRGHANFVTLPNNLSRPTNKQNSPLLSYIKLKTPGVYKLTTVQVGWVC